LYTQAIFRQVYSDRYFLELYLQSLLTDSLLVLRASIDLLLKEVPRNYKVYHLTPAHVAVTIQGHARHLGIDRLIEGQGRQYYRNLGDERDTA
jgi:hypothetical protein